MRTVNFSLLSAACLWMVLASQRVSQAGDTAFWKPYAADGKTYVLMHFDAKDDAAVEGMAQADKAELQGDAAFSGEGKFDGGMRFGGKGALKCAPKAIFPAGQLAVEAWIKLERYPEHEAMIVCRPAVLGKEGPYDPAVDQTKGFALLVDAQGALCLETTNCSGRRAVRTTSDAGAVPLGQWVHVAGISDTFPVGMRRLYVDGREVQAVPIAWGEGIQVSDDEERKAGPLYVGNDAALDAGLSGMVDEVRVHTATAKFWPQDESWPLQSPDRPLVVDAPYFLPSHAPKVYLPLDGDLKEANGHTNVDVQAKDSQFVNGVRGKACLGSISLSAPKLLNRRRGSIEFWMQPVGVNNWADPNRSFLSGPFTVYFTNNGDSLEFKPMTLYFGTPTGPRFLRDELQTEFHAGAWYHIVTTWNGRAVAMYINGREASKTYGYGLAKEGEEGFCDRIDLGPGSPVGIFDEVRLYDQPLEPEEAANAFWRYRQPEKLSKDVPDRVFELEAQVMPSENVVYYQLTPNIPLPQIARVRLQLSDDAGKELLREEMPFVSGQRRQPIPELTDGIYTFSASAISPEGKVLPGGSFRFVRKVFPWEKNTLGLTGEIYPPFTPIEIKDATAGVVGRQYRMNGFGLCDQVVSLDREMLASPMRLRFEIADGEGVWTKTAGDWKRMHRRQSEWVAAAVADPVQVKTLSQIEVDGCISVLMTLAPGKKAAEIRKLWIDIPLKEGETPLMHTIGDGLRSNYSGSSPAGKGVVWDGTKVARIGPWRNAFVPYIWLGGEERGLAWFGENDKGWFTEKNKSKTPTHELVREGGVLTLRVYLVNHPTTLSKQTLLRFGLQASPTKPMPDDWRKRLPDMPGGLAVVPFGGLQCPSQGPFRDDWQIVDKILECREGKPLDEAWFKDYAARYRPPMVHGNWDWVNSVGHFAGRARDIGPKRPLTVYHEELCGSTARPEYVVFQDEWNALPQEYARAQLTPEEMSQGLTKLGRSVDVTFGPSYRDFGCWYANEWLKRGVSLYWDNTFPHLSLNPRTSDAYVSEDGEMQPCLILWNQREYHKRVWNLMMQWRGKRAEPLEWLLHMTNTLTLPIHTWGTIDLDHELNRDTPFPPDWLRTETTGRQVGNMPLSLYPVCGSQNKVFAQLAQTRSRAEVEPLRDRAEWGMRVVHEIQHHGPLDKLLADFGYGQPRVAVLNYWQPKPAVLLHSEEVKWLALSDAAAKKALLVFASWSEAETSVDVSLDAKALGFDLAGARAVDAETGDVLAESAAAGWKLKLGVPYGVRVVMIRSD